jgi:hypothetical protein
MRTGVPPDCKATATLRHDSGCLSSAAYNADFPDVTINRRY